MTRRIVAWTNVSLDGYTSGPDGPAHDGWLYEHVGRPATAEYFEGIWRDADTIVLGRTNYEGFYAVWPDMTRDPSTDPRTRDVGRWLDATEKVVISRTLTDAPWENSLIARDLAGEIGRLREVSGRDVLVINSASVIGELLRLGLIDNLRLADRAGPRRRRAAAVPGWGRRPLRHGGRHGPGARRDRVAPAPGLTEATNQARPASVPAIARSRFQRIPKTWAAGSTRSSSSTIRKAQ